jgi:hypothetical protein
VAKVVSWDGLSRPRLRASVGAGTPPPNPIPIPGGDVIQNPDGSSNLWTSSFQALVHLTMAGMQNPHGITNFKGHVAMGCSLGTATDNNGNQYAVITDIRVYQASDSRSLIHQ